MPSLLPLAISLVALSSTSDGPLVKMLFNLRQGFCGQARCGSVLAEVESTRYQKTLHRRLPSVISRNNQARAQAHCRSTVLGETPRAAAVSGTVMPAK